MDKKTLNDKVSSLMGQYLLKGYAMLDQYCDVCHDPMMRDRNGTLSCVRCSIRAKEDQDAMQVTQTATETENAKNAKMCSGPAAASGDSFEARSFKLTIDALHQKIDWATDELKRCTSVQDCIQFCNLIQSCIETVKKLKDS
ncbi:hypothetical protein HDE_02486 [Halotydeus destructor]|nr:hypothetical protein HDE_02486 [Halotydeus destructor]